MFCQTRGTPWLFDLIFWAFVRANVVGTYVIFPAIQPLLHRILNTLYVPVYIFDFRQPNRFCVHDIRLLDVYRGTRAFSWWIHILTV